MHVRYGFAAIRSDTILRYPLRKEAVHPRGYEGHMREVLKADHTGTTMSSRRHELVLFLLIHRVPIVTSDTTGLREEPLVQLLCNL